MPAAKRTKQIVLRLSPTEFEELNRKKTRPELARWIRETALGESEPKRKIPRTVLAPEVVRILAGMGGNLNQIAKNLNQAAKIGVLGNTEAIRATMQLAALERSFTALRQHLLEQNRDS